jgi:outer membrane protein insertion porin family
MQSVWRRKASAGHRTPGFFRFVFFAFAAIVLFMHSVSSQDGRTIRRLTISGNASVPSGVIAKWLNSQTGGPFYRSDVQTIASRYAGEGFPVARVDSVTFQPAADTTEEDVLFWISEGKPARISSLRLDGLKAMGEAAARSVVHTTVGQKFVPALLERDIGELLTAYEKSGYPFARVSLGEISFEEERDSLGANVVLVIEEGSLASINHFRVDGNTTTKTNVIVRESRIADGEIFRGDQPEKVKQRLQKLQLFSSVSLPELYIHEDGSIGLAVKVTEGNPNRFDGVVGYVPASGSSDGYVTGLADVQFRNILGTGRKFAARWFRETQSSQEINLQYREPWVASLPVNVELGFFQRKQDSTYIRSAFRFAADLMATDQLSLGLVFSSEQVTPSEGLGRRMVSESRAVDIGLVVSYDSRDDPVTPRSGFKYLTEYATGFKEINGSSFQGQNNRSATQKLSFDFEFVVSPFESQVIAIDLYARDFRSSAVELSDLFRLGGANSLRGYREGQFLGSRIAWSNLEYRFLAGQRSFLFGFLDAGYVLTPDRLDAGLVREEIKRVGYGAGLRVDTPLGLIGVSLAFGKGDTFGTSKFHIRLASEF